MRPLRPFGVCIRIGSRWLMLDREFPTKEKARGWVLGRAGDEALFSDPMSEGLLWRVLERILL